MKNIFICHRPYHILRSADIVVKKYSGAHNQNILITYNLININTNNFEKGQMFPTLESYFCRVLRMSRSDDVSIWNLRDFNQYYHRKVKEYKAIADEYRDFDHIFFFSDLEKPIEILVGLLKERKKSEAEITIVDEGFAAYYKARSLWKDLVKSILVKMGNYKYINHTANYGRSHLYTTAMATFPEKCVFRNVPQEKLSPLNLHLLEKVIKSSDVKVNVNSKYILYLSNLIDIIFGYSQAKEIEMLIKMKKIAIKNGYFFYIKPHPVQDEHYYVENNELKECVIFTKLPAEVFFSDNAIIMSAGSSSLINAQVSGVKAVNVCKIFGINNKVLFLDVFAPQNIDEYEQYIKE